MMPGLNLTVPLALLLGLALADPAAAPPVAEGPAPPAAAPKSLRSRAIGELASGSVLAASGLTGIVWMSLGFHLSRLADRELARGIGWSETALAPLHAQKDQGATMIAAGAVLGVAGLALGLALIDGGARDLRAARAARLSRRLHFTPTLGGWLLTGRF